QQLLDEGFQSDGLHAAEIEVVAHNVAIRSSRQQRFNHIIDVVEPSKLLTVAKHLDFIAVDSLADEPSHESLTCVLHELTGTERIDKTKGHRGDTVRLMVNNVVPLASHLVHAVYVDRFQDQVLNDGENIGLAVRLACS